MILSERFCVKCLTVTKWDYIPQRMQYRCSECGGWYTQKCHVQEKVY